MKILLRLRSFFSNIIVFNIFPIITINLLIMFIDFNIEIKELLVQKNILFPYFNTILLLVLNVYYIVKTRIKYFIKNILLIILSNIFAHILSYVNWWIWINSISSRNILFFEERNVQFTILLFLINFILIIIGGVIIQIVLFVLYKKKEKQTNGT